MAIKKILKVNDHILRASGKKPFRDKIVEYFNNIMEAKSNDLSNLSPSKVLSRIFHHHINQRSSREKGENPPQLVHSI